MNLRGAAAAAPIVVVGIGWGLLAPATKALFAVSPAFDGASVAVARGAWAFPVFFVAFVVLLLNERPRLDPSRWLALCAAGIMFGLGITLVFSIAAVHTSISHLSFLIGTSPVTNSALAALVFRIPLGGRERAALLLGIAGVALLALSHTGGTGELYGDALMLVWLAAFAVYASLVRYIGPVISGFFLMSAVGVVAMLAVMLVGLAIPGSFRGVPHVFDSASVAGWFFGEILIGSTFVGQTAYAFAVRRFGVAIATIGAEYIALTVGIVCSIAWHEAWSPLTALAGFILICALGVTFVRLPGRGTRTASA